MKKTIAQQLKIKEFPFEIKDEKGNRLYYESSDGYWCKYELDENSNVLYFENSYNFWRRCELDEKGNILYIEDSDGLIRDNRVPVMTQEEAEKKFNIKIK